ncbi:helix-turn-helix transcriptional regulator [Aquimarina sediminis]|uniref:helix-turn-helix transcriptional regulator n=1 Tax=Aquimarina sediminis TaxID=2070536 RepID=UPI000CA0023D|nr:AraC family transcriptional regulator [Aquimarina sediminis]
MLEILKLIAVFNFLLTTGFIWYNRKKLDTTIYLFSFFLFGKGMTLLSNNLIVGDTFADYPNVFELGVILNSFLFFYAPFLYLFALSIIKGRLSLKDYKIHLVPFFIFVVLNILTVFFLQYREENDIFQKVVQVRNIFESLYFVQIIGYTIASLWVLNRSKLSSKKFTKISKWSKVIVTTFLLIWLVFLSSSLTSQYPDISHFFLLIGVLLLILLSNITLFMLFSNPEYFYNSVVPKLAKSVVNCVITKTNYDKLCDLVYEKKLFKNADLKIVDLSNTLEISARNTSTLIHTFYGGNFYDYINSYRIEEAKKLLENTDQDVTILSILYEAGFNSKSVFNTVFKNMVGETPSSYRKTHITSKYG